ncbi:Hypothetical predicted protein [Podarcis lilfordi]|uniref:Uncharacterized protein n=1 Tax=Podarcis lilfordi TaxID=74358 RepID=A0AA35KDM0_9SAUR|nr:Hypothetical predicted protein [Podarcis lilfordi]
MSLKWSVRRSELGCDVINLRLRSGRSLLTLYDRDRQSACGKLPWGWMGAAARGKNGEGALQRREAPRLRHSSSVAGGLVVSLS